MRAKEKREVDKPAIDAGSLAKADFLTKTERKRFEQIMNVEDAVKVIRKHMADHCSMYYIKRGLTKLRDYLNDEFPDKKAKARLDALLEERKEMFEALIRINNWCCQDLAENAYAGEKSGNYYKTLMGLADICRPFAHLYNSLTEYEGKYEWWLTRGTC